MTPELQAAIDAFKLASYPNQWFDQPGEPDDLPVAGLTRADTAHGSCYDVAQAFSDFLQERGFYAPTVDVQDANEWGLVGVNRYGALTDQANHCATLVDGLIIDFTASQFPGEHDFPRVIPFNRTKTTVVWAY